jgi:hypothetical protein
MIKKIEDNYKFYGLVIIKTTNFFVVLDYGLSNATFETPNHTFTHLWSFSENRIKKEKNGKEKWDVENLVLSDGEKEKTIGNDNPTIAEVAIQEFKTKATMY